MNSKQQKKKIRESNKKRYDTDEEYREYQIEKSKDHRRAVAILMDRHREEFDKIYQKLRNEE